MTSRVVNGCGQPFGHHTLAGGGGIRDVTVSMRCSWARIRLAVSGTGVDTRSLTGCPKHRLTERAADAPCNSEMPSGIY
jgi:hypothetical protein